MKMVKKISFIIVMLLLCAVYAYWNWTTAIYDVNFDNTGMSTPALVSYEKVSQEFFCDKNGLNGLKIRFNLLNQNEIGIYKWEVTDLTAKKKIAEGTVDHTKFSKKGDYVFNFEKIENSKNHKIEVTIQAEGVSEDNAVAITESIPTQSTAILNVSGESQDNVLMLKMITQRFSIETFIVAIGVLAYLCFFVKFMSKLFN